MEYLLHISYNMDFKKGAGKDRTKKLQKILKSDLALFINVVKQGAGTKNTENVARCFFNKDKKLAKITGLDANPRSRFHSILHVLTCGKLID